MSAVLAVVRDFRHGHADLLHRSANLKNTVLLLARACRDLLGFCNQCFIAYLHQLRGVNDFVDNHSQMHLRVRQRHPYLADFVAPANLAVAGEIAVNNFTEAGDNSLQRSQNSTGERQCRGQNQRDPCDDARYHQDAHDAVVFNITLMTEAGGIVLQAQHNLAAINAHQ